MMLCRYAIITDTVNFSKVAQKTTPTDIDVVEKLDTKLRVHWREKDYKMIAVAKQDTKNLTVSQCLRKDLKVRKLCI